MQPTVIKTFTVPQIPGSPSKVANGTTVPVRVVVRNDAGVPIFLATDDAVLTGPDAPGNDSWTLDPGDSEIFVMAPREGLFAIAAGGGAQISVTISEALPRALNV